MPATYAELQTEIAGWLDRDDLTSYIPTFISNAEAEFNRVIWSPETESSTTLSADAATTTLPTDFRAVRSIYIDSDPRVVPDQMTLSELRWAHSAQTTGAIQNYAIQGGTTMVWGPSPDTTYSVPLVYYAKIPALATASTNWLLTSHPDIYMYGSLLQAEAFLVHDERIGLWQQKLALALAQLEQMGVRKSFGGTQRIRAPQVV